MTRINVVPPQELCDKHLLAEHRELTRIPNNIVNGKAVIRDLPSAYTLGTGHVKFFYNKLAYLYKRYLTLTEECKARGFNVTNRWPDIDSTLLWYKPLYQDYQPTDAALAINRERIQDRMPVNAKFTPATHSYVI